MKRTLITLVMMLGLVAAAFGAGADAELKKIEEQWLDAYMKSDPTFIKNLEAEDYWVVEPDGNISKKADDVKSVTDKKFVLKSATMSDFKCRMIGDNCAVVTATIKMSGTDDGEEFSGDYRGTDVFEKKDGKWMAVASQLTKVSSEKK
ncbi:MAG TPA: nuclear transport factor 2 family protein [Chthoniobacterales bacterium]|nr:nuclear transport factor 2 family protein [Chthoniobacterales bacterium]